ncbi:MAG: ABC transporter ATP-binding protein [Bacteroidetes bacterium]|nr:ABC transporter ATP-binding protein [Bacteroidota bacterium]
MSFRLDHVSFRYPDHQFLTLDALNFSIEPGSFVSVIGPNGSGKSTLLKLLAGIHPPAMGSIWYHDRSFHTMRPEERATHIAYVPQQHPLLFTMTVTELVATGRAPYLNWWGQQTAADLQAMDEAMNLADIHHLKPLPVDQLSGGEQQRVWIARALAQQSETILLDEPTAHLDIRHQIDVYQLLKKLQTHSGRTIVTACHDLNLAARFSSHILVLVCGRPFRFGTVADTLTPSVIRDAFQVNTHIESTLAGIRIDLIPDPADP